MFPELTQNPLIELLVRFAIDVLAMFALVFGIYYRRYFDKELVAAAALFNIAVFCVLTVLSNVEFSLAAGFGLFAILALFTLRSEQITKVEIAYFFGSVAIAVICAIDGTALILVGLTVSLVLIGAYALDHPKLLKSVEGIKVVLDKIDPHALSDKKRMKADLSARLGVTVVHYQIISFDYVQELARINVYYLKL